MYSSLTTIGLKLGWGIKFSEKYLVKFEDVDVDWTKVKIRVYENNNPMKTFILAEDETGYYPSQDNILLAIKISGIWKDKGVVYVKLSTPMKLLEDNMVLNEGDSYTLPKLFPKFSIKLLDVPSDTQAKFRITYPDGETVDKLLEKDSPIKVPYRLNSDFVQSPFLVITLVSAKKDDEAVVDIYVPKFVFSNPQVIKPPEETEEEEQLTPTEATQLVYSDILYVGENLTIEYNNTKYNILLKSVGYYSRFAVLDSKGKTLEEFSVREGNIYLCTKAPLRIEIPPNSVDMTYNRTYVKVYAPLGAIAKPIIRSAKVTAELKVSTKDLLLGGDELIVFIKVKNEGRGNAFQVRVVAPVPNNFELRSGIGAWTLNTLEAFSEMPVLVYTLKPKAVGTYTLGPVIVEYYDEAGRKITVKSNVIEKINVYAVPRISLNVEGFSNSSWSNYVIAKENSTVKLRFTIKAYGNNNEYEFIKNASLLVSLGDFLDGKDVIEIGTLKAGEEKVVDSQYLVLKQGVYPLKVVLKFQDPLGGWHTIEYPNTVLINSVPPRIIVKENTKVIEKYPSPEELPEFIKEVLASQENATYLAEEIANITKEYLKESNKESPKGVSLVDVLTFIVIALVIVSGWTGYSMVKYKNELEKLKARRKQPRPGGLPKKEEEEISEIKVLTE
ncbi:hypothetical protein Py04_1252 [Pyrococcus sp. ST04]|nr:hypothetical protein Py04_1252 [Pyrococcus sp. ST04]